MHQYGISESLVYNPKPKAAAASKIRINQPALNGGTTAAFTPTQTIQIAIPCGTKGQYLNTRQSYLKFKINNTDGTNSLTLDYSASAVFRLLEVVYGSTTLEYIDQYNVLYHALLDAQGQSTNHAYSGNVVEGIDSVRTGVTIAASGSLTVCVPIISGVLGTLQSKYIPIGDMVRNHLRLQLTLANTNEAQATATTASTGWTVSDVELICEVVQLNSETAKAISELNQSGYVIPMHTFACHSNSLESGTQNANILISGNYRSLKTLISIFRKQSNLTDGTKAGLTLRTNPFTDSNSRAQFNIGGTYVPQKAVMSRAEAYAELMKSFHAYGACENYGIITKTTWEAAEGTFMFAQDLESQSHKSSLTEAGIDVSSAPIHLVCDFPSALASALRVDTFSHQDAVLIIDPTGMAQVVF